MQEEAKEECNRCKAAGKEEVNFRSFGVEGFRVAISGAGPLQRGNIPRAANIMRRRFSFSFFLTSS